MNLKEEYDNQCNISSDISEHLPILLEMAKKCEHITEMGVRTGVSTRAFLYSAPKKYFAYDLNLDSTVSQLFEYCQSKGKDYYYIQANVLEIEIEETDLLFIDTFHSYDQLKKELELHSNKVRKYIAFHDTYTFGRKPEGNLGKGILYAIEEFLEENKSWSIIHNVEYNNGLMIIEKN